MCGTRVLTTDFKIWESRPFDEELDAANVRSRSRASKPAEAATVAGPASSSPTTSEPAKRVYTMVEAARLLNISRASLWQLTARKEIRSILIGRRRLIPAEAIEIFIQERLQEG